MRRLLLILFSIILFSANKANAQAFTINGPEAICSGTSATLTATGCAGTLQWSTQETSASITVSPTQTTTYYVVCTDGSNSQVASISPVVSPTIQISSSSGNCLSGTATLTATGAPSGTKFRWKKNGVLIANAIAATYDATQPGTYTAEPQAEAWTWQNPLPDGEDFNDIFFVDDNVGIAVGNYGKIVRSTDGGETWTTIPYGYKYDLKSVHFTSSTVGWICGNSGAGLLKTTDGGLSWSSVSIPYYYSWTKIFFTDSNTGWMLANNSQVLRTTDGGGSWAAYATGINYATSIFFSDALTGWVIGQSGQAKKTTDGGLNWNTVTVDANYYNTFTDTYFTSASVGWIVGYNALYKTTDGGSTWVNLSGTFPANTNFTSIFFTDANYGIVATSRGVWNTPNAGGFWGPTTNPGVQATGIFMRSITKAWITGRNGIIQRGYQGASQYAWKITMGIGSYYPTSYSPSLDFVNSQVGWVINGADQILKTTNGGKVWSAINNTSGFHSLDFVDENTGYAIKRYPTTIYKSTDGGSTWNHLYSANEYNFAPNIQFTSATTGWVTGGSTVFRTTDGGNNWAAYSPGFGDIRSMHFLDASVGWVGGANGKLAKTTDGGITWNPVTSGISGDIELIYYKNGTEGWISSNYNSTRKTQDGGLTWTDNTINGANIKFHSITFHGSNLGLALSNVGYSAYKTLNGGTTWEQLQIPTRTFFQKIQFTDAANAWLTDGYGRIMHYSAPTTSCSSNALTLTASPAAPVITASVAGEVVCSTTSVTLTASGCSGTLQWSTGATTASIKASSTASATYTAFCTAPGGCVSSANYSLGVVPTPQLLASSTSLCANENVELLLNSQNINSSYLAWKRDGTLLADASGTSYVANQAGTYTVEDTVTRGTWVTYSPTPHNYSYNDVFFTDANTGYTVGNNGIIYKTTDGGNIWLPLNSGTNYPLKKVQFTDASTGYVIPDYGGIVLKTTDAGMNWSTIYTNNYSNYAGLFFSNATTGWIVGSGGLILKTTNAGQSWTPQNSGTTQTLKDIFFVDTNTGWAVGTSGTVLKTTDGGQTWTPQSSGTTQQLNAVQFLNASTGWAVGSLATLSKTTDGGATWITTSNIGGWHNTLSTLHFFNSTDGILVGTYLSIRTSDGGNTFQIDNNTKYGERPTGLYFINNSTGYMVGENAQVFKSTNSGATWQTYTKTDDYVLRNTFFLDEINGWGIISGDNILYKTTNGGEFFSKINPGGSYPDFNFNDVEFKTISTGWVCGNTGVFKTVDGGQSWNSQYSQTSENFVDLFFLDSQNGWAVGVNFNGGTSGRILRTTNGGTTWQASNLGNSFLNKVFFVNSLVGWVTDFQGYIYKTTDGGVNWSPQTSGTSQQLNTLYFSDANNGWIGGPQILLRTTNGGTTWVPVSFPTYISPQAIKIDGGVGWVVNSDAAYYTKNNGQSWEASSLGGESQSINGASFFLSGKIFINSYNGGRAAFLPKPSSCTAATVTILPAPVAATVTASTLSLCEGQSVTLTGSGCSGSLSWSTGSTAAAITVTPYSTTTYTTYCAGTNGCKSTTYTGIGVLPKVRIDTASIAPCYRPGLTASNFWYGIPLLWKKDGAAQGAASNAPASARLVPAQPGAYTVEPQVGGLLVPQDGALSSNNLSDITFPTATIGFAIGNAGTILKTTDGGATWQTQQSGTTNDLRRIQMLSATLGYVVGSNSTILKTTDGGTTWIKQKVSTNNFYMYDLSFVNANVGWATGNYVIFYTTNGGVTWTPQSSGTNYNLFAIHAINANTAWVVGPNGLVVKTTNAGASWAPVNIGTSQTLNDVFFTDANHGWAVGSGNTIRKTTNGGVSWESVSLGTNSSYSLGQAFFLNNTIGWVNSGGTFFGTTDGGVSWTANPTIQTSIGYPYRFAMKDSQSGYFVGYGGVIATTSNGATSWERITGNSKSPLRDVHFVNTTIGFAIGYDNKLMSTTDGGKKWTSRSINTPTYFYPNDLFFVNATHGWVATSREVYRTTNGGVSWQPYTFTNYGASNSLYFVNASTGWTVGSLGAIHKTTDGGSSWTSQTSGTTQSLQSVFFLNANVGWAVGTNGTVVATTNGGSTWTSPANISNLYLSSVSFTSSTNGWATAQSSNGLYHTANGGNTWSQVILDPISFNYPVRVQFLTEDIGFVLSNNALYSTIDGGGTWKKTHTNGFVNAMYFTDATHGWLVGSNILSFQPAPAACPSAPVSILPQHILALSTLQSGNWNSPAVWSCGTIPTVLDAVRINSPHTITLPTDYTATAKSVELQGNIQYNANAQVQLGQQ